MEDYDEGEEVGIKLLQQLLGLLDTKFIQRDIYGDGLCLKSKYKVLNLTVKKVVIVAVVTSLN